MCVCVCVIMHICTYIHTYKHPARVVFISLNQNVFLLASRCFEHLATTLTEPFFFSATIRYNIRIAHHNYQYIDSVCAIHVYIPVYMCCVSNACTHDYLPWRYLSVCVCVFLWYA